MIGWAKGTTVRATAYPQTSAALSNLRGVFILILLAFHACVPYLASAPAPAASFEAPPYSWLAFPIVDSRRFFGFDLYCAWEDAQVMAMMFFLSGVFVAPSLRRKGAARFAADRAWRLAPPFLLGLFVLSPLALFPVFRRLNPDANVADYLAAYLRLPFLPNGPQWFVWLLLAFALVTAAVSALCPGALDRLGALASGARHRPGPFLLALAVAATWAYLPPMLAYGPFDWFESGPFSFQKSRPLLYGVFFVAGVAAGANGMGEGLLAADGALAKGWRRLAMAAPLALFAWMGLMGIGLTWPKVAPLAMTFFSGVAYVAACVTGVASLLSASVRFGGQPVRWLAPLGRNAMGIFALHYAPMIWIQDALTSAAVPAPVKACFVFAATLVISLALSSAIRRSVALAWLIGEAPVSAPALPEYARP